MKKIITISLIGLLYLTAHTQVVLKKTGDFKVGDKTLYVSVSLDSFAFGASGPNVIWDFSKMANAKSVNLETFRTVIGNKYQKVFNHANLISDNGDSSFVFMDISGDTNKVYGFVDEKRGMVVEYTKPYISMVRPLHYRDSIYCTSERKYESYGYTYTGKGYAYYVVDGFGKLITPNGAYEHVLRVKSVQEFTDQMTNGYGDMQMKMITYAWYDDIHKNALCKINYMELKSPYFNGEYITMQYMQNNL